MTEITKSSSSKIPPVDTSSIEALGLNSKIVLSDDLKVEEPTSKTPYKDNGSNLAKEPVLASKMPTSSNDMILKVRFALKRKMKFLNKEKTRLSSLKNYHALNQVVTDIRCILRLQNSLKKMPSNEIEALLIELGA